MLSCAAAVLCTSLCAREAPSQTLSTAQSLVSASLLILVVSVLCRLHSAGEAPQWTLRRSREAGTGSIWSTPQEKSHTMCQCSQVSSLGTNRVTCSVETLWPSSLNFQKVLESP